MYKFEAIEAAPICARVLGVLLTQAPTRGRTGADLRTAVNSFIANSLALLQSDEAGPPLNDIFVLARQTGIGFPGLDLARAAAVAEAPVSIGAFIVKNVLIELALVTECEVIAATAFTSRDDVDAVRSQMNAAFIPMEEVAADEMAQANYQALIHLHAAVIFYLTETARPLPMMLQYRFFDTLPSVVMAHKLYADASRADELREENKIVHPAFMTRTGQALAN
jgi:prophage DNA circulation protein